MTPPRFSLVAAGLLAGFALGWFCRPSTESTAPAAEEHPAHVVAATPQGTPVGDPAQDFAAAVAGSGTDYQKRLDLAKAASGLDRAEVVAALEREHARNPPTGYDRTLPTEALLARFAELDPAAAMAWLAQTYPGDKCENAWMEVVMDTWVEKDQSAAMVWVRGLPPGTLRNAASYQLFARLSSVNPTLAVQQAALFADERANFGFPEVFTAFAKHDLRAAREQALGYPAKLAALAVNAVAAVWTERDPAGAYAWAKSLPSGSLRDNATQQVYVTWQKHDPAAAGAWLVAHGGADIADYSYQVALSWATRDLAAARAWSELLPAPARIRAIDAVVSVWMRDDPRGATVCAMSLPENMRVSIIEQTVTAWAAADKEAALAWIEQQPAGSVRNGALSSVCSVWVEKDPRACAEYLIQHAEQDQLSNVATNWANNHPEEVWQWSQGLSDPKARATAATAAVEALTRSDPTGASARLSQLPPEAQEEATGKVAARWVEADPSAAAQWAGGLPEGAARLAAWNIVSDNWGNYDAPAAAAWLGTLPPCDDRDHAVALFLGRSETLAPVTASVLARSLRDPEMQERTLENVAHGWLRHDRAAATAWINQTPEFTPEVRNGLLGVGR